MNISFFFFLFILTCIWAIPCFFATVWLCNKNKIQPDTAGLCFCLFGIIGGLFMPLIVSKFYIIPNVAQYETKPAIELYEKENDGKITQFLVYEGGKEINLTEKTGKYYTKLPDSEYKREYCTFLWVVKWDQSFITGLDFKEQN